MARVDARESAELGDAAREFQLRQLAQAFYLNVRGRHAQVALGLGSSRKVSIGAEEPFVPSL
jgi:hypothetical protein